MGVRRLFSREDKIFQGGRAKTYIMPKNTKKDNIFLKKVKNILFWPVRCKGPLLPSPVNAHDKTMQTIIRSY